MPGSIRVSVFKCVDLPAELTGGKYVSMKVGVGKREFQTKPSNVDENKTAVWNSDFSYPVLNLRDNLMVILLDSEGNAISQTAILTLVIVERGSLEELFPLKGGGRVHLKLSFVLTLEERMRIDAMRESALEKRTTVKTNAIQRMKPLEENKTSDSDATEGILQTIPENAKSKDNSQNEKNHITPVVVSQLSFPNEMRNEEKSIKEASPASISPAIEYVTHQEGPSHELKDISGHNSKGGGQHSLPQHDFNGALIQNKTPSPNTKDTMKDHGDPGNSDPHESIDKLSTLEPGQSELEKKDTTLISADIVVISEVSSSQTLLTRAEEIPAPGFQLHQENSTLTSPSGSCSPHESSDSKGSANSAILFTTGDKTSEMPPEPISLIEVDGNANVLSVKTSNEEDIASSRLSTPPSVMPSQSSTDGSMLPTPSDTRSGSIACGASATEGLCGRSSLHTVPTQSSSTAEGLRKSIRSNTVNLIDSRVKTRVSTANSKPAASHSMKGSAVKAKIKAFESALSSETMRGDGKRNSVKAKIKAFESNLTQDPDHHNASPRITNPIIEAEKARQRLRVEAAAAEAAEAKRRAEEEELKLKSIADARERSSGLPKRPSESRARTMVKRQYLERNEGEDKRETKEDIKHITVMEDDRKIHETYKGKEVRIWKLHEKWSEIGETSIKQKELIEEPTPSEMLASQGSKISEQKQDTGAQAGQSELYNHEPGKSVAEARWIANEKATQKHENDHELIIDQRVHSVAPMDSSEEEASLSEKKLEDLVNDSAACGGFIKQLVGAAALLATGALFMWMRGERMNRRARTTRPNYQPYFHPNDAATHKMDQEGIDHPISRIFNHSKEFLFP